MPYRHISPFLKGRDVMNAVEIMQQLLANAEFIDMTRIMEEGMPYWPTQPAFEAETIESQELGNESYFRKIVMCEHTGTHIDAGCHFVPGKQSVDEIPVTQIIGRALNIDATDTPACGVADVNVIKRFEEQFGSVSDIEDSKLEEALKNGATDVINSKYEDVSEKCHELTEGYGVTLTIDAACVKGSLLTALKATGNAGRVITMGFSVAPDEINQFLITSKELDVRGSRLQNGKFQEVIDLVKEGKIDLKGSISHKFYFEDAQKAFDFVDTKDPSIRKIVLTFEK